MARSNPALVAAGRAAAALESKLSGYVTSEELVVNGSSGRELGYAETTTTFTQAVSANTDTNVTGLQVTVTTGSRPIYIVVSSQLVTHSVASSIVTTKIMEGSTQITASNLFLPNAGTGNFVMVRARLAPVAGSHTYKVMVRTPTAGTINFWATGGLAPAYIQVVEC